MKGLANNQTYASKTRELPNIQTAEICRRVNILAKTEEIDMSHSAPILPNVFRLWDKRSECNSNSKKEGLCNTTEASPQQKELCSFFFCKWSLLLVDCKRRVMAFCRTSMPSHDIVIYYHGLLFDGCINMGQGRFPSSKYPSCCLRWTFLSMTIPSDV